MNRRSEKRTAGLALFVAALCLILFRPPGRGVADDGPVAVEAPRAADGDQYERAVIIELDGVVSPMMKAFLERKLETARQRGADLVVLRIDSPGGYLHTMHDVADRLRELPWARTVAYVPDMALSAAAIVALACDEIVMHPDARMGDAGPIEMGGGGVFEHAEAKVVSDLAAYVRHLAEVKGRPPALAEAMVNRNLVVFEATHRETQRIAYYSEAEFESLVDAEDWEKGRPIFETREEHFLTVVGKRAVELGVADAVIDDETQLAARYGVSKPIERLSHTYVDTTVHILNLPLVTGLLFVIGLGALMVELSAPGISFGGLLSGLCFALFFWSRVLGGTSTWLEIVLFLAGAAFLAVELFVIPGFGISGVAGALLMLAGVVLASQDFIVPSSQRQVGTLVQTVGVVAASGVAFLAVAYGISKWYGEIPVLNRLALRPPTDDHFPSDKKGAGEKGTSGESPEDSLIAVGEWGIAVSPLRPAGRAKFGPRFVDVVADGSYVTAGSQVRITSIEGSRIVVQPIEEA